MISSEAKNTAQATLLAEQLWPAHAARILLFGNEKQNEADFINRRLAEQFETPLDGEEPPEFAERVQKQQTALAASFDIYLISHGYRTEKVEGRRGRLAFFATYFDRMGLEIINPHKRDTGVGTNPIYIESVPDDDGPLQSALLAL